MIDFRVSGSPTTQDLPFYRRIRSSYLSIIIAVCRVATPTRMAVHRLRMPSPVVDRCSSTEGWC